MRVVGRTTGITDAMIEDQLCWYEPERVILFRSHARGEPAADIDIVILKNAPERFLDRLKRAYERWTLPVAMDILVYMPAKWEQMIREVRGFIMPIVKEGREIYARPGQ